MDEIYEQPLVLERFVRACRDPIARFADEIERNNPRYVLIAARGTSDNAARYAQYLWGGVNRLPVALATPSLFARYGRAPGLESALVVGISQSGQSPDIAEVVAEGRRQGCLTLVITNDPRSPLALEGQHVLDLDAGPERSVAATKTYTAELLAIATVSAALAHDVAMSATLGRIAEMAESMLGRAAEFEDSAARLGSLERCAVLGRGFHLATAFEWALKLQELCEVAALPFSLADFEHGPIALAGPGFPVLGAASPGPFADDLRALMARLGRARGVEGLAIGGGLGSEHVRSIDLPEGLPEWAAPIVAIVGAQLFCLHLALAKGLDPDEPRGLRKVTRTT